MIKSFETEKSLVRNLAQVFEEKKPSRLKRIFAHTNLTTKKFKDIWMSWWETDVPPRLEVDFIFAFEDIKKVIDNLLLVAVEVEFFRDIRKSFYDGLQQVLGFSLFGFDSLVLWHIFHERISDEDIKSRVNAINEIINGFDLPIVYMATKINEKSEFRFFAPIESYAYNKPDYLISYLMKLCSDKRNPLLSVDKKPFGPFREEVRKRRKTLKVMLKIPA